MTVTVVVPVYNRSAYIETCLRSLLRHAETVRLDILVIDDGSDDDGPEKVARLAERHPEIRLVRQKNMGVVATRSRSRTLLLPETEFVTFLDSDDTSPPGSFHEQLSVFTRSPEIQFTYGLLELTRAIDDATGLPAPGAETVVVRGVSLSAAMFRRPFFDSLGDFDLELQHGEDLDFLLRAIELDVPCRRTDVVCCIYRRHDDNMTNDIQASRRYFLLALHKALRRRRANPRLVDATSFFDIRALQDSKVL